MGYFNRGARQETAEDNCGDCKGEGSAAQGHGGLGKIFRGDIGKATHGRRAAEAEDRIGRVSNHIGSH